MRALDSRKFLLVGMLLLVSTLGVNGASPFRSSQGTPVVKDVSFNTTGEVLEVKITATEGAKFTYFELTSPPRLVVDFPGIQNELGFKEREIEHNAVARIRASLFKDRKRQATRIVFDLKENVPYDVVDDGNGIVRVTFGMTRPAPMNLTAGPPAFVPEPEKSTALLTHLPNVRLTSSVFENQLEPPAPPPPPEIVEVQTTAPAAAPVQAPAPAQPRQEPPPAPTNIIIGPPMTPEMPLARPQPIPQYQGEIYSFELTDNFPIRDFFFLISQISGLNVVIDPGVTGSLNIRLTAVPWDQALDIVLKQNRLTAVLQGNVLRIAQSTTILQEEQARVAQRQATEAAEPTINRTYIMSYTTAAAVSAILRTPGILSPRASILADPRQNALIISDIPGSFSKIDEIVKFLDTPAKQVEIEARLLSANKSFRKDIGNQLGFLFGQRSGNVITGAPGTVSPVSRTPPPRIATGSGVPLLADLPSNAVTGGLSFFLQPGGDILLDEIITAAESRGTAKLISRPKVMTQNNIAATISQGTQIPVQTNVNNTVTTTFLEFNLQLTVTPQITEAGTILLTIAVENSTPNFNQSVGGIPPVSSQKANTQVLIPDGATAVIGGILVDNDSFTVEQVPGLGSLPVIGHLFKKTSTLKETTELLFFITPRIKPQDTMTIGAPGSPPPPPPPGGGK
ncbi:MAG: type IV pilus secretin PilQ [Acidobacteria bacterium]|nr:type IV pilus secretin PilQ [Acidobacteriota bacterium]